MDVILRKPAEQRIELTALHLEDDDIDASIVKLIAGMTEDLELRITRVRNVDEARAAISSAVFDIHLVDVGLPDDTSLSFVKTLERCGASAIILSNLSSQEATELRLKAGNWQVLSKSDLTPRSLKDAVVASLPRRHLNGESRAARALSEADRAA